MDRARVKAEKSRGCTESFGSFELIYPKNLYGVIEPLEFETTIKSINEKCHSVLPKKYLLLLLPSLVGIILLISGVNTEDFDSSRTLFITGMILIFIGACLYGIATYIFSSEVINKIKTELGIVNNHFLPRRINWSLESEMQVKYISDFEYNAHKDNRAYMQNVKFDRDNRPYKQVLVYFIEIQFPALPSNYNLTVAPLPSSNSLPSNIPSSNHSNISLGINGGTTQFSFGLNSSSLSNGDYTSISMNTL